MAFIFVNFNFCDYLNVIIEMNGKVQDNMHCIIPFLYNKCIIYTYICVDKGKVLEGITLSQGIVADIKWSSDKGVFLLTWYIAKCAFKIFCTFYFVLSCIVLFCHTSFFTCCHCNKNTHPHYEFPCTGNNLLTNCGIWNCWGTKETFPIIFLGNYAAGAECNLIHSETTRSELS